MSGSSSFLIGRAFRRGLCSDLDAELGLRRAITKKLAQQRRGTDQTSPAPPLGPVARMATAALRPGGADSLVTAYESEGRMLYSKCPGFLGSVLLLDRERNRARSITLWQSATEMNGAVSQDGYADTMKTLGSHFADAPNLETWELGAYFFSRPDPVTKHK
jgi:hypothetical protein